MNFTVNGAYRSDNNLIRIRSPDLAEDYLVEFEEMFTNRQFVPNSPANTPYRQGMSMEIRLRFIFHRMMALSNG